MPIQANRPLLSPHLRALVELHLDGSLPLRFRETYAEALRRTQPVAIWQLDEWAALTCRNTGTLGAALDGSYSATGCTLRVTGGLADDPSPGTTFNGTGLVQVAGTMALADAFTISAWFKGTDATGHFLASVTGTGPTFGIIGKRIRGGSTAQWGTTASAQSTVTDLDDNRWHHAVWTKSGAVNHIYVDGIDVTDLASGGFANVACTGGAGWEIGSTYAGTLQAVAVHDYALAPETAVQLYRTGRGWAGDALGGGPALVSTDDVVVPELATRGRLYGDDSTYARLVLALDPLAYWRLGDNGTVMVDAGRRGFHGQWVDSGTGASRIEGVLPGALVGDGDQALDATAAGHAMGIVAHDALFNFGTTTDFTINCWVYARGGGPGALGCVLTKRLLGTVATPFEIVFDPSNNVAYFYRITTTNVSVILTLPVPDGWSQVSILKKGLALWACVNGVPQVSGDYATLDLASGSVATTDALGLGAYADRYYALDGAAVDEVALWNRALAFTDLMDLWRAGVGASNALFSARLLAVPALALATSSPFGGLQTVESLTLRCANIDNYFTEAFRDREIRDKRVVAHLYDALTGELRRRVFAGSIAAPTPTLDELQLVATSDDLALLAMPMPRDRVDGTYVNIPADGDRGAPLSAGWGYGERIPGRYVRARLDDNDPSYHDYDFGPGNYGLVRVWQGDRPIPVTDDLSTGRPFVYIPQAYAQRGLAHTAIRFDDRQAGSLSPGDLFPTTADLLAVYPPQTGATLLDVKWLGDFDDTSGRQHHLAADAVVDMDGTTYPNTTAPTALVTGPHGPGALGVGALDCGGALYGRWLLVERGEDFRVPTLTVAAWVHVRSGAASWNVIMSGPHLTVTGFPSWEVAVDVATATDMVGTARLSVEATDVLAPGVPLDQWVLVTWTIAPDGAVQGYVDDELRAQTSVAAGTALAPFDYTGPAQRPAVGIDLNTGLSFSGWLGPLRVDAAVWSPAMVFDAYHRMWRNPVWALREWLTRDLEDRVHEGLFRLATQEFDAIPQLYCDGWIVEETDARAVIEGFAQFLGLCLLRDDRDQLGLDYGRAPRWSAPRTVLAQHPVAYWRADGSADAVAQPDSTGFDHRLVPVGTGVAVTTGAGPVARAFVFTDGGAGLGCRDTDAAALIEALLDGQWAVSFWYRNLAAAATRTLIACYTDTVGPLLACELQMQTSGALLYIYTAPKDLAAVSVAIGTLPSLMDGAWHHAVVSRATFDVTLIVDGQVIATTALTEPALVPPALGATAVLLGTGSLAAPGGSLAEVALFDAPLSLAQAVEQETAQVWHGQSRIDASFGVGPPWNNVLDVPGRRIASTTEALAVLPVAYRPRRDARGAFQDFTATLPFEIGPVGRVGDVLAMPFVVEWATADYLGAWHAFWASLRDEGLMVVLGHEARWLRPGAAVQVSLPGQVVPMAERQGRYLVEGLQMQGARHEVLLTPMDDFSYIPGSYSDYLLTLGPLAYYRFDEPLAEDGTFPTVALDSSGYARDADIVNGALTGYPGALAGDPSLSLAFRRDAAFPMYGAVQVPGAAAWQVGSQGVAVAGWFRFEAVPISNPAVAFALRGGTGGTPGSITIALDQVGHIIITITNDSSTTTTLPIADRDYSDNRWHFVMLLCPNDGTASTRAWVDGECRAELTGSVRTIASTAAVTFGCPATGSTEAYAGGVDELAIWIGAPATLPSDAMAQQLWRLGAGLDPIRLAPLQPQVDAGYALDLGTTPQLRVGANDIGSVGAVGLGTGGEHTRSISVGTSIDIELANVESLFLRAGDRLGGVTAFVGCTATDWWMALALDDASTSYLETYLNNPSGAQGLGYLAPSVARHFATVRSIKTHAVVWNGTAARPFECYGTFVLAGQYVFGAPLGSSATSPTVFEHEWTKNPITGDPWTITDVQHLRIGLSWRQNYAAAGYPSPPIPTDSIRWGYFTTIVTSINDRPNNFSFARVWRTSTATPPALEDPAIYVGPSLIGIPDPQLPSGLQVAGQQYYYWARVYDAAGRPSPLIGPTQVTYA